MESAVPTIRAVLGADDVQLERVASPPAPQWAGTVFTTDLAARGGPPWRMAVLRDRPLDAAESAVARAFADLLGRALTAAEDAELAERLADLVDAVLLELDVMIGATVEERLVKVARDLAEVIDAKGWSVRILVDGQWMLVADEHRRGRMADPVAGWAPYDPRMLELDEGSIAVRPGDGTTVSTALDDGRLSSLVGATGYDPDAVSWTVCMIGDEISGDLTPARTALAALVPAALGFPLPPRSGGLLRRIG